MTSQTTTLEEMCCEIVDCPHFTPEWTASGYIVIRNENIRDGRLDLSNPSYTSKTDFERRIKRAKPRAGDIVFTREAPMGQVCMIPAGQELCLGQRQVLLRPKAEVDGNYLFYALQSDFVRHQIFWNEGTGSTVSNVRIPVLKALRIPRAGAQEKLIGNTLSSLDEKIEVSRRTNDTLEAIAQAIFKDWFIDFGPTRRKLAGMDSSLKIMGGLVQDRVQADALASLFPSSLNMNGLPVGWEEQPIGDLSDIVGGSTPSTSEPKYWIEGKHLWATPKDLSKLDGIFLVDTERHVSDEGLAKITSRLSPAGTVLLSSRAPIGYLAIAALPTAINQGFIALRPTDKMPTAYTYLWCKENLDLIKAHANGSTFQEISKKNFRPLPALVPGDKIMQAFTQLVAPLLDLMMSNSAIANDLTQTRDLLLPKLMSGEVRIQDECGTSVDE